MPDEVPVHSYCGAANEDGVSVGPSGSGCGVMEDEAEEQWNHGIPLADPDRAQRAAGRWRLRPWGK